MVENEFSGLCHILKSIETFVQWFSKFPIIIKISSQVSPSPAPTVKGVAAMPCTSLEDGDAELLELPGQAGNKETYSTESSNQKACDSFVYNGLTHC